MGVDPLFQEFLADPRNTVRPPPSHVPMAKVRKAANAAMMGARGPNMHSVEQLAAQIDGRSLALRLYRPSAEASLPLVLLCHGGGWVWGDLETHDAFCRQLAQRSGAAVAAIEYRLAPETRFPGQLEDVFGALRWARAQASELDLDPERIALCGDSAGGNLATSAALLARRDGIALRHLALIYPALDPACDSASHTSFAEGYVLTREAMLWFWQCYLGEGAGAADPLAAPGRAGPDALSCLPPVTIATAECDILRDEGEAFAKRLEEAGVPVRLRRYQGMIHGFLSLPVAAEPASRAIADLADDLAAALK